MKLLKTKQKQETFGGAFSTAAWVAVAGIGLLVASISSLVGSVASNNQPNNTNTAASGSRPTASIRMAAVPSRSSVSFWV